MRTIFTTHTLSFVGDVLNFCGVFFFFPTKAFQASVAKSVPEEPAEDAEGAVSRLRFRVPGGGVITRSFWSENTLQDVLNFLTAQGFHTEDYKVITTYPRRDVSSYIF